MQCWFLLKWEIQTIKPGENVEGTAVDNQQTQPTHGIGQTWDTAVEDECSYHYANPAPRNG